MVTGISEGAIVIAPVCNMKIAPQEALQTLDS
jgi:hypothetical protein